MSKTYRKKPKEVLKTQQEFEKICDFLNKLLNINYSLAELHDLLKFDFYMRFEFEKRARSKGMDCQELREDIYQALLNYRQKAYLKTVNAKRDHSVENEFNIFMKSYSKAIRKETKRKLLGAIRKNVVLSELEDFDETFDLDLKINRLKRREKMLYEICFFEKY